MPGSPCSRCQMVGVHQWVEDDCVLPHGYSNPQHPPTARVGRICNGCAERWRLSLTEIVELYGTLGMVVPLGSIIEDDSEYQKPRKAPASPAPFRLAAWAMLHDRGRLYRTGSPADLPDVPAVLTDLAQRCLDDQGLEGGSLDGTCSTAARVLTEHLSRLASGPWVDEFDADLRWVRRQLRQAHGVVNPKPVGRCPTLDGDGTQCRGPLWPAKDGSMAVDCGRCSRHYDELFLRHLGGMMEASA